MCGRYTLTGYERIPDFLEVDEVRIGPRFNIAPTQEVPAVKLDREGRRRLDFYRWGLIPFWAKDPKMGARMINARSETVETKPAFRNAFAWHRCLIPADGYYEWRKSADGKQPYLFRLQGGGLFAFAGLWERWKSPQGDHTLSCTILTTEANPLAGLVHDRMPAILPRDRHRLWLDPGSEPEVLKSLLVPYAGTDLESFPVSRVVNNPRNEVPECVEPSGERLRV